MGESEHTPLTKAELARHWGVSRPYLTKLAKPETEGGHAMPVFTTLAEADAWRAVHAAPRAGRVESLFAGEQSSSEKPVEAAEKSSVPSGTTTGTDTRAGAGGRGGKPKGRAADALAHLVPERIDIEAMVRRDVDFDSLMVTQAEEVPQVAHGLFKLAATTGSPSVISAATRNWHEATSASADVRTRFLAIQEKSRALISLDEVMDLLGTELQAVRSAMLKVGERCANDANPSDPALARRVIDAAIDAIFEQLTAVATRAQRELSAHAT